MTEGDAAMEDSQCMETEEGMESRSSQEPEVVEGVNITGETFTHETKNHRKALIGESGPT